MVELTDRYQIITRDKKPLGHMSESAKYEEYLQAYTEELLIYLYPDNNRETEYSVFNNVIHRIGGDPEFFLEDDSERVIPMFKLLGVSHDFKDNFWKERGKPPALVGGRSTTSWWHADGIQAELGYFPSHCLCWTADHIQSALCNLASMGYTISNKTEVKVPKKLAVEVPLGCRPSFNAYTGVSSIENTASLSRFCGGHFHVNIAKLDDLPMASIAFNQAVVRNISLFKIDPLTIRQVFDPLVRALDATIGILSVAIAGSLDSRRRRLSGYGIAGDYRITNHTLEYRVPSNVMYMHPVVWHIISMMLRAVVGIWFKKNSSATKVLLKKYIDNECESGNDVAGIINRTDYVQAREYLISHGVGGKSRLTKFLEILSMNDNYLAGKEASKKIEYIAHLGVKRSLGTDLYKNWRISDGWTSHSDGANCALTHYMMPCT